MATLKAAARETKSLSALTNFWGVYGILFQDNFKYILDILVSYEEKIGFPLPPPARLELFATTFHQLVA